MTPADAIAAILAAPSPAALFGDDPHGGYRRLARLVHPDRTSEPGAARAFARLADLRRAATTPDVIRSPRHAYTLGRRIAEGDLATLYAVGWDGGSGVLKVLRNPANRDLAQAEADALARFAVRVEPRRRAFLPDLVEAFAIRDEATGVLRPALVMRALEDGFLPLTAIAAAYPAGLDARHAAWIFRRLLVALGSAHRAGVVHGAVTPDHVLVHPTLHGVVLVDWCYSSTEPATPLAAIVPRHRALYPADLLAKAPVTPGSDLAMAAATIASILGADAPHPIRRFLAGCAPANPAGRPDDAFGLLAEFDACIDRLWPRAYRPLEMPPEPGHPNGAAEPRRM